MMEPVLTLCEYCCILFSHKSFNVDNESETTVASFLHVDTLPELLRLRKNSDSGCAFCAELRRRITAHDWPDNARELRIGPAMLIHESMWETLEPEQEGISMIEVPVASDAAARILLRFDIFAAPGSYASTQMRVRRRPPSNDRTSPEGIARVRELISDCTDGHWQCNQGDKGFWPTRLIDVGPTDGSRLAKLVKTSGVPSKYLALSHCWGLPGLGIRTLKTTSATIASHMIGIPLKSMPRNFQDAVFMTRALGVRYIWIDSLCIVQDSRDDWAAEGSQMDKIYKSAWLTLAATSASTSEDGFLDYQLRDRSFTIPLQHCQSPMEITLQARNNDHIVARFMETRNSSRLEPDIDESTWNSRGWTLQERHLSQRILHFSRTQIFWECRRGFASECGTRIKQLPISITRAYGAGDSSDESDSETRSVDEYSSIEVGHDLTKSEDVPVHSKSSLASAAWPSESINVRAGLYDWWFTVLADYSNRKLTFTSDKFPAISGLAKEVNNTLSNITGKGDQYVAGLWIAALPECLLWVPVQPTREGASDTFRAPSWSWACCNGPFIPSLSSWPNLRPESNTIDYVGHDCELETSNQYGSVKHAVLRIRAGLIRVKASYSCIPDGNDGRYNVTLVDSKEEFGVMTFDHLQDTKLQGQHHALYAMQVKVQCEFMRGHSGLVVRSANAPDTYKRIGVFSLDEQHLQILSEVERNIITLV
ncbi:heterokaryon incompatibility protein-domain-containing protein [Paraphoma chrysanthemicola]|uniref:Heterokaryon incompatibility protein-domain-containing protein n=1 Tax=Paraphoma chrysanthemicola TaxID=798071 RepID=A0A8K0RD13_9PLEO|nr:heterokaryon incompatibility protein-domain-containing protein [Paraphoma chrysanthemicola]